MLFLAHQSFLKGFKERSHFSLSSNVRIAKTQHQQYNRTNMGIKNTKAFWPPNFPSEEKTIVLGNGSTELLAFKGHTWVKYNGRTIAIMPSHVTGGRSVSMRVGYISKTYAPIEISIGESMVLYDTTFHLTEIKSENDLSYKYEVSKATKSATVELNFNTTTQINFETVLKHSHNGIEYYMTLGSIGEKHVDFFIWNSSFEVVESVSFGNNSKWCNIGDFAFNLQGSNNDSASIIVKKQTTREVPIGDVALSFDEIIRVKDKNNKVVTLQVVKFLPPRMFDVWCTLDVAGQDQTTGYLKDITEDSGPKEFALLYSIECKSIQSVPNAAPKFNLSIKAIDSLRANFNQEFTLNKNQSTQINGTDLKIRFDGSSHKEKSDGQVVGFFHLTTIMNGNENRHQIRIDENDTARFQLDYYEGRMIRTTYDESVTLVIEQQQCNKTHV